jgi:hypothetical protein
LLSAADCAALALTATATGVCEPNACPSPCAADFNRSGGLSAQDIFDFLAAFFAGC